MSFALAELHETQKNIAGAHATYDALIGTLSKNLDALDVQIKAEVDAARASVHLNGADAHADESTPAVVEAEDRARKVRERRSKDLEAAKGELGVVWIMLMRFARRAEGLKPARTIFAKARRDKWCAWCVYEAAGRSPLYCGIAAQTDGMFVFFSLEALMEYHCTKAADVATKIFEIGLKIFAEDVEYVTRYLGFLISINDENSQSPLIYLCTNGNC